MPRRDRPTDYKSAAYALSEEQHFAQETAGMRSGFLGVGQAIEGTRGSLQRLTQQVKAADEIFTRTARRGEILGVRALAEYTLAHNKINEVFSKSTSSWTHGFEAVQSHAQGAASHLLNFVSELGHFHHTRTELTADYEKALERQRRLEGFMVQARDDGNLKLAQSLALRASEAGRAAVIGKYEIQMLEARRASIPLMVVWGETVGRVLAQSFELQRNFRDVNLDFARSVDFTRTLLSAVGSSGGLVTLKEAADTARALRGYSLDFLKPEIIERVSLFHELTGVSSESVAKILYQLKSIGGEMPDVNNLTNSFTYFARETDLGASGVADLLGKMDPLITSVPKEMRENLITQVLALGDAFKKAGLNADEMIKTIQEMQDFTSSEGRKKAGLIASATGMNPLDLMMGNMDPAKIGYLWTQTQRQYMQRLTQGGRINAQTAATILSRRFGGSIEEWKIAGGKTDTQMADMQKQIATDEASAKRVENFSKAFNELTSGPISKLSAILASLNVLTLEVGTNIIQGINKGLADFNKAFPAVHKGLSSFFKWMTDEKGSGFRWAVNVLTKTVIVLTPILGFGLVRAIGGVISAGGLLILTFRKLGQVMEETAGANLLGIKNEEKAAGGLLKTEAELASKAATGGGGFFKKMLGWFGIDKLIGAGGAVGGGFLGKIFGGGAEKAGLEGLEKGGVELLTKGAGKAGAKWLTKGFSSLFPWVGEIVSLGWAAKDIFQIINDPKESLWGKIWKSTLKLLGGAVGGLTPLGFGLSMLIDLFVGSMDKNTDATQKNTAQKEKENAANAPASAKMGGGQGAPPITGDAYSKMGSGTGGGIGGYKPDVWDPVLTSIANKYGINPRLLTSIARAEGVAPGDFNPLGISPHGGGPTHYPNVAAGAAGMEAYVKAHLPHFKEATKTGDINKFATWYTGTEQGNPNARRVGNDIYGTNWQEAQNIRRFMTGPGIERQSSFSPMDPRGGVSGQGVSSTTSRSGASKTYGVINIGGENFQYVSGGAGKGAAPSGEYMITGEKAPIRGMSSDGVSYDFIIDDKPGSGRGDLRIHPSKGATEGCIGILGNAEIQHRFETAMRAELKRRGGRVPLHLRQESETPTAQLSAGREHQELTAADRHGKAMIAELQMSNRMNKERLHYLRQQRFLGPTLLPAAADDTLANV